MANTNYRPLLDTPPPTKRSNGVKYLCIVLSIAAVLGCIIATFSVTIPFITRQPNVASSKSYLCKHAINPSSCLAVLSEVTQHSPGLLQKPSDVDLLRMVLEKSSHHIREIMDFTRRVTARMNGQSYPGALATCIELMDSSIDQLTDSMVALGTIQTGRRDSQYSDIHTWLSSVLTNHVTCLDELNGAARSAMEPMMNEMIARARASLAVFVAIKPPKREQDMLEKPLNGDFPSWITSEDRRLLQSSGQNIKADSVVAKDGSGDFTTVQAALDAAPKSPKKRYVIYVKKGTYKEKLEIKHKNLTLAGDGMDATIITYDWGYNDAGNSTSKTASVAATGRGFMAQDICFKNTAGPEKHQAVALRVQSHQSVINRCKIDAYQDTLYPHSNRQFYRDCYITGTVDFIFGDAAVVFQNCDLVARKPMKNQKNMVTAQGKIDSNSNTGTSIQNCNIIPSDDLAQVQGSFKSFLGRPWKNFSTTVVMQSYIGDHIDPAGWYPWNKDDYLDTLYYGEYKNRGPRADTSKRVTWPGYHVITSAAEASKFTVAELLQGDDPWLDETGVDYEEGLYDSVKNN